MTFYVFIVQTELVFTDQLDGFPTSRVAWRCHGKVDARGRAMARRLAADAYPLPASGGLAPQHGAYYHLEPVEKIDDLMSLIPGPGHSGPGWYAYLTEYPDEGSELLSCPYGEPGDRLWVRETWRVGAWLECDESISVDYRADDSCRLEWLDVPDPDMFERLWVQSTDEARKAFGPHDVYRWSAGDSPCRWRPSIHMPRWASRILLEVVDVRVELLKDISAIDAIAEGATWRENVTGFRGREVGWSMDWSRVGELSNYASGGVMGGREKRPLTEGDICLGSARSAFGNLWNKINEARGFGWDSNPWVWVVTFKLIDPAPDGVIR